MYWVWSHVRVTHNSPSTLQSCWDGTSPLAFCLFSVQPHLTDSFCLLPPCTSRPSTHINARRQVCPPGNTQTPPCFTLQRCNRGTYHRDDMERNVCSLFYISETPKTQQRLKLSSHLSKWLKYRFRFIYTFIVFNFFLEKHLRPS